MHCSPPDSTGLCKNIPWDVCVFAFCVGVFVRECQSKDMRENSSLHSSETRLVIQSTVAVITMYKQEVLRRNICYFCAKVNKPVVLQMCHQRKLGSSNQSLQSYKAIREEGLDQCKNKRSKRDLSWRCSEEFLCCVDSGKWLHFPWAPPPTVVKLWSFLQYRLFEPTSLCDNILQI